MAINYEEEYIDTPFVDGDIVRVGKLFVTEPMVIAISDFISLGDNNADLCLAARNIYDSADYDLIATRGQRLCVSFYLQGSTGRILGYNPDYCFLIDDELWLSHKKPILRNQQWTRRGDVVSSVKNGKRIMRIHRSKALNNYAEDLTLLVYGLLKI